jgi:predicted RNA binding protein YcfA (HicA-like mRNA interferase family)
MPVLPVVSGQEAVRAFERAGWEIKRQRGSHIILTKLGSWASLSIPDHRELDRGLLRKLIRQSGLTVEEFTELLGGR